MHLSEHEPDTRDNPPAGADFWRVLATGKLLILASIVACVSAAGLYLWLKAPAYEARVKLRVGQVGGVGPIEPVELVASRLMAQHGEDVADGVRREPPFLRRVTVTRNQPHMVELVAWGRQPADAARLLREVAAEVRKAHEAILLQNTTPLVERLDAIEAQRRSLLKLADDAVALTESLKVSNPVQASLLALERARIAGSITTLDSDRANLAVRLAVPQTQGSGIMGDIIEPIEPASPRRAVLLALAAAIGLLAGVVLALARHDRGRSRG